MSYIIGQYNHTQNSGDDRSFISLILNGNATRRTTSSSPAAGGTVADAFEDECLKLVDTSFSYSNYYYFRCYIKRMPTEQVFYVKLLNYDDTSVEAPEQYIKTVIVQGGLVDEWISVEFLFHPVIEFDTVVFELQRTVEDYRSGARYPFIAYQELGVVQSIIKAPQIADGVTLLKIGVQSHPGLAMCINGEEIHTSRSGIYELKNGILPITFFSIVSAAKEDTNTMETWMEDIGSRSVDIEQQVEDEIITRAQASEIYKGMSSAHFFDTSKTISIDPFILDYMYEK